MVIITFEVLAKGLGFVALFVTMTGYINKNDQYLRIAIAIAAGLLSVHYFMLSAWVAGISLAINFFRNQVAVKKSGFNWFLLFAVPQVLLGLLLYKGPLDVFPVIGSLLSGYAFFCTKDVKMRVLMLVCTLMWLTVNLMLTSYGAALQDTLSISMNLIGITRVMKDRKQTSL